MAKHMREFESKAQSAADDAMRTIHALKAGGAHAGLSYSSIVAQVVTEVRKARGLSQEELARRAGMTQSALSRIEHGETVFSADHAIKIAPVLGTEPGIIFTIADRAARWLRGQDLEVEPRKSAARASILGPGAASMLIGGMVAGAVHSALAAGSTAGTGIIKKK